MDQTTLVPPSPTTTPNEQEQLQQQPESEPKKRPRWKTLESNPDVINKVRTLLMIPSTPSGSDSKCGSWRDSLIIHKLFLMNYYSIVVRFIDIVLLEKNTQCYYTLIVYVWIGSSTIMVTFSLGTINYS